MYSSVPKKNITSGTLLYQMAVPAWTSLYQVTVDIPKHKHGIKEKIAKSKKKPWPHQLQVNQRHTFVPDDKKKVHLKGSERSSP